MSKKLAFVEKNVLFYSELPFGYHPKHHIHNFLFSFGDILRPEVAMCIWRILRIVSSLKASPIILRCYPRPSDLSRRLLFFDDIVCPVRMDACYIFRFL